MIDEMWGYRESQLPAAKLSEEWEELSDKFEATLSDEQVKMFHRLSDLQSASAADEVRAAYNMGFKDGAKMMLEVQK